MVWIRKINDKEAADFFRHYHHDRGMLKWQGFFLSDHTHALENERNKKGPKYLPKQDMAEISRLLKLSWQAQKIIVIQLNQYVVKNLELTQYQGVVKGYQSENIILACTDQYLKININDIRGWRII